MILIPLLQCALIKNTLTLQAAWEGYWAHTHRLGDVLGCPDLAQLDVAWVLAQGFSKVSRVGLRVHTWPGLNHWPHLYYSPGSSPPLGCQIQGCAQVACAQSYFGPHLWAPLQAAARNWRQQQKRRQGQQCY